MKTLKNMDLDKVAQTIEANAGQALPGLRESLAEAKAGVFAQVHTPDNSASGDGWQTRINDTLRASLALSGKVKAQTVG